MKQKTLTISYLLLFFLIFTANNYAQQGPSMYGDKAKADVKMNYVYSLEEALKQAHAQKKPIFFNCFVDWAVPCHMMNQQVFSDQSFCDYMNRNFINLFMEMTSPEAAPIAKKYEVQAFAHYLVLDSEGNILLRILGGKTLPEFKECIMLALNPKTSLPGAEKIYQSGKYGKKDLLSYLNVLKLAGDHTRFNQISKEYFPLLKPKEYTQKKNWVVVSNFIDSRNSDLYQYLIDHKTEFEKNIGAKTINRFIESFYYIDLHKYATGKETYDGVKMLNLYNEMVNVGLADSCISYKIYQIAKLRGEKKYDELFDYMRQNRENLNMIKYEIETSFDFPDMTDKQKVSLAAYLRESAQKLPKSTLKKQLEILALQAESHHDQKGIQFESIGFDEALAKAKNTNRLVFLDCYTTWCGPCRMMANQIFVLPEVGELFNRRFINLKIDMEKGEGITLAKKYNVTAFPTMLILDGEGNIVQRIRGARDKGRLMKIASDANIETGYTASKKAFEEGIRTADVIYGYTHALKESGELNSQQYSQIINDFFARVDDKEFCDRKTWKLIEATVNDANSKEFSKILTLHNELANQNGTEVINRKIETVVLPYITRFFNSEISEKEVMNILSTISTGHYPQEYSLNILARLIPMYHQNNPDKVLDFYEKQVALMKKETDRLKIDLLLSHFLTKANTAQLERAQAYVKKAMAQVDSQTARQYESILQTLTNNKQQL